MAVIQPTAGPRHVPRSLDLLAPIAVTGVMVAVAGTTGHVDAVFPELAALTFGAWCFRLPAWHRSPWQLFWLPSAMATVGVSIQRWSGWSRGPEEAAIGTFAVLALAALDSPVVPALSAGLLPVVLGVSSWLYPLTVALSTALVAGVVMWQHRPATPSRPPAIRRRRHVARHPGVTRARQHWPWQMTGWFLLVLWAAVTVAAVTGIPLLALPPLFVAAYDQIRNRADERRSWRRSVERALRDVLLLGIAAGVAVGARVGLGNRVEGAVAAIVVVAAFAVWRRIELLPLFPIAILPALLPANQLSTYLWTVPAEAALLGLLAVLVPVVRDVTTSRGAAPALVSSIERSARRTVDMENAPTRSPPPGSPLPRSDSGPRRSRGPRSCEGATSLPSQGRCDA